MSETQTEVLEMIHSVAKSRNEDLNTFMDSDFGVFWSERYANAHPTAPEGRAQIGHVPKEAPVETNGFTLLREEAWRLRKQDNDLSPEQAVVKAAQLHPDLVQRHEQEMRGIVA